MIDQWPPQGEFESPLKGHSALPHFCGKSDCGTNVPGKVEPFCGDKSGPYTHFSTTMSASCTRLKGHEGRHAGYPFSISEPAEW